MLSKEIIELALEKLRPFLKEDEGEIELVQIDEDGIVKVRFLGSCKNCPLSSMTLRAGIERALMKDFPSIKRIEAVN